MLSLRFRLLSYVGLTVFQGCISDPGQSGVTAGGTFGADLEFLKKHTEIIVLGESGEAQVAIAPAYQGRVLTSTVGGASGPSFGWINRQAISSGERQAHINVFGGEDRFWLGPEGGQYSIYFKAGDPFDLEHWQVPEPIDWGSWEILSRGESEGRFRKAMSLTNYSGTKFELEVDRTVRLLADAVTRQILGLTPSESVRAVAFESTTKITNTGDKPWRKESGLLSVWILGMFNPSPETTIVIPFKTGPEESLGPIVNDAYFGKVPGDRLVVGDGVLFFRGDGQHRSKIGVSGARATPSVGSYDAARRVLTLVSYTRPEDATDYVNSMWEIQKEPYRGDVVNSYNDGPPEPGARPLGPFYELETSSPAALLGLGESLIHVHRTFHLLGAEEALDRMARAKLMVNLEQIKRAFNKTPTSP